MRIIRWIVSLFNPGKYDYRYDEDRYFRSTRRTSDEGRNGQNQQQNGYQQHRTTQHGDNVIIDKRDPNVANRKIFDKNEGEYVDFKEED